MKEGIRKAKYCSLAQLMVAKGEKKSTMQHHSYQNLPESIQRNPVPGSVIQSSVHCGLCLDETFKLTDWMFSDKRQLCWKGKVVCSHCFWECWKESTLFEIHQAVILTFYLTKESMWKWLEFSSDYVFIHVWVLILKTYCYYPQGDPGICVQ